MNTVTYIPQTTKSLTIPTGAVYIQTVICTFHYPQVNTAYITCLASGCGAVTGKSTAFATSAQGKNGSEWQSFVNTTQRNDSSSGGHMSIAFLAKPKVANAKVDVVVTLYGTAGTKAPGVWVHGSYIQLKA